MSLRKFRDMNLADKFLAAASVLSLTISAGAMASGMVQAHDGLSARAECMDRLRASTPCAQRESWVIERAVEGHERFINFMPLFIAGALLYPRK